MGLPEQTTYEQDIEPSRNQTKNDGTERQGIDETLKRWEEWTKECFSKSQDIMEPRLEHISEAWGRVNKESGELI